MFFENMFQKSTLLVSSRNGVSQSTMMTQRALNRASSSAAVPQMKRSGLLRLISRSKRCFSTVTSVIEYERTAQKPLESWEEVDINYPRVPTLDGYQRPKNAPLPSELTREQYHQYMLGRPERFSKEFQTWICGVCMCALCMSIMAFASFKLKPDDFDWLEEERTRAERAKIRISERNEKRMAALREAESKGDGGQAKA